MTGEKTGLMPKRGLLVALAVGCLGCPGAPPPTALPPIEVRGLFALTGPTSEIGVSYARGVLDAIDDVNADGGLRGHRVAMEALDYAYDAGAAVAIYDAWRSDAGSWDEVVTIFGWGTNGTVELAAEVAKDRKPFISASYAGTIGSPVPVERSVELPDAGVFTVSSPGAPYNFYAGTDYSTSIRLAIDFAVERGANYLGFAYCSASYCTEPIPAGKVHAKSKNLTDTGDLRVELTDTYDEARAKVAAFFAAQPDTEWLWVGNTRKTAVYIAKAVREEKPSAKLIINVFGFDEAVYAECGQDCVDRSGTAGGAVYGIVPFAAFGDLQYPAMEEVLRVHREARAAEGVALSFYADLRYVQGYASFSVWRTAVERVLAKGDAVTGPAIRAALESPPPIDTGGLTAPITFTATDHRPNSKARVYSINEYGKLQFQEEMSLALREEWLGW